MTRVNTKTRNLVSERPADFARDYIGATKFTIDEAQLPLIHNDYYERREIDLGIEANSSNTIEEIFSTLEELSDPIFDPKFNKSTALSMTGGTPKSNAKTTTKKRIFQLIEDHGLKDLRKIILWRHMLLYFPISGGNLDVAKEISIPTVLSRIFEEPKLSGELMMCENELVNIISTPQTDGDGGISPSYSTMSSSFVDLVKEHNRFHYHLRMGKVTKWETWLNALQNGFSLSVTGFGSLYQLLRCFSSSISKKVLDDGFLEAWVKERLKSGNLEFNDEMVMRIMTMFDSYLGINNIKTESNNSFVYLKNDFYACEHALLTNVNQSTRNSQLLIGSNQLSKQEAKIDPVENEVTKKNSTNKKKSKKESKKGKEKDSKKSNKVAEKETDEVAEMPKVGLPTKPAFDFSFHLTGFNPRYIGDDKDWKILKATLLQFATEILLHAFDKFIKQTIPATNNIPIKIIKSSDIKSQTNETNKSETKQEESETNKSMGFRDAKFSINQPKPEKPKPTLKQIRRVLAKRHYSQNFHVIEEIIEEAKLVGINMKSIQTLFNAREVTGSTNKKTNKERTKVAGASSTMSSTPTKSIAMKSKRSTAKMGEQTAQEEREEAVKVFWDRVFRKDGDGPDLGLSLIHEEDDEDVSMGTPMSTVMETGKSISKIPQLDLKNVKRPSDLDNIPTPTRNRTLQRQHTPVGTKTLQHQRQHTPVRSFTPVRSKTPVRSATEVLGLRPKTPFSTPQRTRSASPARFMSPLPAERFRPFGIFKTPRSQPNNTPRSEQSKLGTPSRLGTPAKVGTPKQIGEKVLATPMSARSTVSNMSMMSDASTRSNMSTLTYSAYGLGKSVHGLDSTSDENTTDTSTASAPLSSIHLFEIVEFLSYLVKRTRTKILLIFHGYELIHSEELLNILADCKKQNPVYFNMLFNCMDVSKMSTCVTVMNERMLKLSHRVHHSHLPYSLFETTLKENQKVQQFAKANARNAGNVAKRRKIGMEFEDDDRMMDIEDDGIYSDDEDGNNKNASDFSYFPRLKVSCESFTEKHIGILLLICWKMVKGRRVMGMKGTELYKKAQTHMALAPTGVAKILTEIMEQELIDIKNVENTEKSYALQCSESYLASKSSNSSSGTKGDEILYYLIQKAREQKLVVILQEIKML